jgi:putative ABC transport system permease protein
MRGTLRWARADLRARRGQAILTVGAIAGVVAALVLATMLLEGATNPWQGLFTRSHGADVLVYLTDGTPVTGLAALPGVQAVTPAYQTAAASLEQGATRSPVELQAMTTRLPPISTPLMVAGSWLRIDDRNGVVVEASFAAAAHVAVGDRISVESVDSPPVSMSVIGIADTSDQGFYPQWTPGLIWVQRGELARVQPDAAETQEVVGLRLTDPSNTSQAVGEVYGSINDASSRIERVTTWVDVRSSMASNDRLLGLLLALFGIVALVAAPCAIANVTAGRVLVQRQDIAMLKALGFTPGQVIRMLLAEQTALGVAGTGLGLLVAWIATSPEFVRPPDGTQVSLAPLPGSWVALIAAGTVLTVAVATAIPAWWAGTVSPVAAVAPSPPRGRLSLIARLSLLVHLPAALVLGARDSFTRRLPAALTVIGVAIPMIMITIALTCWSTIDGFSRDPGRIGLAAALTVSATDLTSSAVTSSATDSVVTYISRDPQVRAWYPGAEVDALLPDGSSTITARAMGYSYQPYPFEAVQGSLYHSASEADAGQGLLDLLHLRVGSWTWLTIDGVPVIFHIVGRTIEPDNNGDVIDFGLDALNEAEGGTATPQFYSLVLKAGVNPVAARARLLAASRGQLEVNVVANPADGLWIVRVVIAISVVVLGVIGLANLLTATVIGLRDHLNEVGVLKAMGLTPRQVTATLVINSTILTAVGVTLGVLAGLEIGPRLVNMQGVASGMGSGIAAALSPEVIAATVLAALIIATAAALLVARRASASPAARAAPGHRRPTLHATH